MPAPGALLALPQQGQSKAGVRSKGKVKPTPNWEMFAFATTNCSEGKIPVSPGTTPGISFGLLTQSLQAGTELRPEPRLPKFILQSSWGEKGLDREGGRDGGRKERGK